MKLDRPAGSQLTYCTNVHPGESWDEVKRALETHVSAVKARVCPGGPFGVGLRLSAEAARALESPAALDEARGLFAQLGLYVFTVNGFPYGAFHATRVKERVYSPDWLEPERRRYTASLARVLAALLPSGVAGSISTVPGCFRARAKASDARRIAHQLARSAADLLAIERETGRRVTLALEPEPACLLETTADAVGFFEGELWSPEVVAEFGARIGVGRPGDAETELRARVGVCLDACHASVEFEPPVRALERLLGAGVTVPKIQLSAALRVAEPGPAALERLRAFDDGVYLHQTRIRSADGGLLRFVDLPEALAERRADVAGDEWRVHCHVPICESDFGLLGSTAPELRELLESAKTLAPHLEVETYTFEVLPPEHRSAPVADVVARELLWVKQALAARA